SVEREGAHAVALDLTIDADLRREGQAREIVHAVQNARKSADLQVEDRIELALSGDAALIEAATDHGDYIAGETLASSFSLGGADLGDTDSDTGAKSAAPAAAATEHREQAEIDGLELLIALRRVRRDDG